MTGKIPNGVTFVVSALNEQAVIERVVREIWKTVEGLETFEIILVDDGSTDRTGEIMDALARKLPNVRVLHNKPNIGLGASYQRGVGEAKFDYVMMLCGDGGLPASSLPAIIDKIGTADIVIPYMTNLREIKTPLRYVISRSYTLLLNSLSGQRLNYYNGLPVHRRDLLLRTPVKGSGFGFQGEILVRLLKAGHSYVQVGVLGAETTNKTSVFRLKNFASVSKTIWDLFKFAVVSRLCKKSNQTSSAKSRQRPVG